MSKFSDLVSRCQQSSFGDVAAASIESMTFFDVWLLLSLVRNPVLNWAQVRNPVLLTRC